MGRRDPIPLVRCRLDGVDSGAPSSVRYIPAAEFGLWRHLMQTRHRRRVVIEAVSMWVSDEWARGFQACAPEDLEPVVRLALEIRGPSGVGIPVERFFPAETYPEARRAFLSHYQGERRPQKVVSTPGYFLPPGSRVAPRVVETADAA